MNNNIRSYFIGVLWFILSLFSSSVNDIIAKYAGMRLHSYEITFLRFLFSSLTLIPFIWYYGIASLKTMRPIVHLMRGVLLFLGIAGWIYGLSIVPVTTATVVSFTIPVFVLVLGYFFLHEHVIWQRWVITIIAFVGLIITLNLNTQNFEPKVLLFVAAAIIFAILDVINKRFVIQETMISMLFYSAIITAVLALPFAMQYWIQPTIQECLLLFMLGASANLILFFLLKAFALVDATALAPYRYCELIVSATMSYLVFGEIPSQATIIGSCIIIPSTLFVIYSEKQQVIQKKQDEKS